MKDRKISLGSIIGGLVLLAAGVVILAKQDAFVKIVVILSGVAAFADGIYTLLEFREWKFVGITNKLTLIKGVLMTVSGIIGVVMPLFAAQAIVTVVVYVFASMLVYSAFVSVQDAVVLKKISKEFSVGHFYVEAAFSALVAVIFFSDPYKILNAFVTIIAIAVLVVGSLFFAYGFYGKKRN